MKNIKYVAGGIGFLATAMLSVSGSADTVGTAKATVTIPQGTFNFSGGSCIYGDGNLVVNIGEHSAPGGGPGPDYFGAIISKVPGHFENAVVSFVKDGKRYALFNAVSGDATPKGGSFSGHLMDGAGAATGSFSC
jgi:hypothetical protein